MASSEPEIKDGFTLPVWMKTKPTNTREFEPFAASPPAPEDSFFYIRYPKKDMIFGKTQLDHELPSMMSQQTSELAAGAYSGREKDWSKHTKSCQDVLHGIPPINTAVNSPAQKPKPAGTDDGFKGEGAACGSSVVKVAHQMISLTRTPRGFTVATPGDEEDAQAPEPHQYNLAARRGSKSLPASPSTSPTSRRKMNGNRYFTSPFEPAEDATNRSWLTMALLGFKKDLTTSTSTLTEEDTIENRLHGPGSTLAESVESLGPAPKGKELKKIASESTIQPPIAKSAHAFRPKPSELREMNFWSPTSM